MIWTVVVAGGSATRFGGPKQYELLGDRRVARLGGRGGGCRERRRGRRAARRRTPGAPGTVAGGRDAVGVRALRVGGRARRRHDRLRARRRSSVRHCRAVRGGDRRGPRRRRRRGARRPRQPTRSRSSTRPAWSPRPPIAARWSRCRRRRPSGPPSCAGPTPHGARAPTTPRSSSALGGQRGRRAAARPQPQDHRPDDLAWARRGARRSDERPGRSGVRHPPLQRRPGAPARARRLPSSRACAVWTVTATPTPSPTPSPTRCSAPPASATSASTSPTPIARWKGADSLQLLRARRRRSCVARVG